MNKLKSIVTDKRIMAAAVMALGVTVAVSTFASGGPSATSSRASSTLTVRTWINRDSTAGYLRTGTPKCEPYDSNNPYNGSTQDCMLGGVHFTIKCNAQSGKGKKIKPTPQLGMQYNKSDYGTVDSELSDDYGTATFQVKNTESGRVRCVVTMVSASAKEGKYKLVSPRSQPINMVGQGPRELRFEWTNALAK